MDETIAQLAAEGARRKLLLHACCAPCSSSVLELVSAYFDVTVFFYNPNITEEAEYRRRLGEEERLIARFNAHIARGEALLPGEPEKTDAAMRTPVRMAESVYEPAAFFDAVRGLENEPEGGARCERCFTLRLTRTAEAAAAGGFDFFTTTLTLSPRKDADRLNRIGAAVSAKTQVAFLPSDFKKKNGYLRSLQLSKAYDLYRQDYCGCVYSRAARGCAACGRECADNGLREIAG